MKAKLASGFETTCSMSVAYSAVPDARLIVLSIRGLVTRTEVLVLHDALLKDPALGPSADMLVRAIDARPDLSVRDIIEISRRTPELTERGLRRILIVANSLLAYALARIFSTFVAAPDCSVHVFHTEEDALAWLAGTEQVLIAWTQERRW